MQKKKVSKIKVLEKRNNIYIYIDDFVEGSQPWQKTTTSKILVPEQRNFNFWEGSQPWKKQQLSKLKCWKKETICLEASQTRKEKQAQKL